GGTTSSTTGGPTGGVPGSGSTGGTPIAAGPGGSSGGGSSSAGGGASSGGAGAGTQQQSQNNGGATDTGVTATSINIATIYDGTGPEPGLFNAAKDATIAAAAYVNSQGGIFGRQVHVDALDDQT